MNRFSAIAAAVALAAGSAPAFAQTVEVASGDWSNIPAIEPRGSQFIDEPTVLLLERIARSGDCEAAGFRRNSLDIRVPLLLRFQPDGGIERIVLARSGCDELDRHLGGIVLKLARAGEYQGTGENQTGWYRSEFAFVSR